MKSRIDILNTALRNEMMEIVTKGQFTTRKADYDFISESIIENTRISWTLSNIDNQTKQIDHIIEALQFEEAKKSYLSSMTTKIADNQRLKLLTETQFEKLENACQEYFNKHNFAIPLRAASNTYFKFLFFRESNMTSPSAATKNINFQKNSI